MRKIGMWILHHFVRVIWANLFGLITLIKYSISGNKDEYLKNKRVYDDITTIDQLIEWTRRVYRYKWDGWRGAFDHNNFYREFFTDYGDCDDLARYACKKIKQIYGDELQYCYVKGFSDLSCGFWHYDCVYKLRAEYECRLYNYGNIQSAMTLNDLDNVMRELYSAKYEFKRMTSWRCLWM
jgi:hypothetical protein